MKKRLFGLILALAMVISIIPFAMASEGDNGTISKPTADGNAFFANGTPITITETAPKNGTLITFDKFTATGESAYISWKEDDTTKYVGVNGTSASIYGGSDGRSDAVSVPSTSITMTGGTIWNLFGGNYGEENANTDYCSTVEEDVNISLSGTAVVKNLLHGAGARNTCVNGTITMTFNGVDLSDETSMLYVNGGSWGNGNEGTRDVENGAMNTNAVANQVVINAVNSKFYLLGGGGSGSTKVKDSDITLTGCEVDFLYLSGINGEVVESSISATNCTIGSFSATNRGFVGTGNVDLNNCSVTKLNTGAAEGCFSSDSRETDGSGVTGSVVYNIDAASNVGEAVLTPHVMRIDNQYTNTIQNVTINKEGAPLTLSVSSFDAVYDGSATATTVLKEFLVPEGSSLNLNNVNATLESENELTNAGTINMFNTSRLNVPTGATLNQAGSVNGGQVIGDGSITNYVARVGNTGYETLGEAIDAVKEQGGTITLLCDAELKNANNDVIQGDVTIQGNYTITASPAAGQRTKVFTLNNGSSLTLDGVTLNITGTTNDDGQKEGDGINVKYGAELTLKDATVTFTNMFAPTVFEASEGTTTLGKVVLNNSTIISTGARGNFSNGGDWTIENGSVVTITDNGNHGLSVENLVVDNSIVRVDGAKYLGLYGSAITLRNNANVSVTNSATDSNYFETSTYGQAYLKKGAIQLKGTGTLTVDNSIVSLSGNGNGANTGEQSIYIGNGNLTNNNSQINGTVVLADDATGYVVTFMSEGQQYTAHVVTDIVAMPTAPTRPGHAFLGWSDGSKIYQPGDDVTISGDTTFTALWQYIPPADPSYQITIPGTANGTVTVSPASAKEDQVVTITVTPNSGYELTALTVTDRSGNRVTVTANPDGTYRFVMPASQVTVSAAFAPAQLPFTDVTEANWYYDEVYYVWANGLMQGTSATTFGPNVDTTRAMVVTILWRLEGEPASGYDMDYSDVAGGAWYADAVRWATEHGIVNGSEGQFYPGGTVTREQLAAMLYRYAQYKGYDLTAGGDLSGFADAGAVSGWAETSLAWAVGQRLIQGSANQIDPTGSAIRAQLAAILMRFMENVAN